MAGARSEVPGGVLTLSVPATQPRRLRRPEAASCRVCSVSWSTHCPQAQVPQECWQTGKLTVPKCQLFLFCCFVLDRFNGALLIANTLIHVAASLLCRLVLFWFFLLAFAGRQQQRACCTSWMWHKLCGTPDSMPQVSCKQFWYPHELLQRCNFPWLCIELWRMNAAHALD